MDARAACLALALWGLPVAAAPVATAPVSPDRAASLLAEADALDDRDPRAAAGLVQQAVAALGESAPLARRLEALAQLCITTAVFDPQAALPIAERGLALARDSNQRGHEARLAHCQGYAHEQLGDLDKAGVAYEQAVLLAEESAEPEPLSLALASRGEIRHGRGEYDLAITDLKRAYDYAVAAGLGGQQRYTLNAIANLYADGNVRQFDLAIATFRKLLAANEAEGLRAGVATAHFNLGATLERMDVLDQALFHYRQAYDIDRTLDDPDSVAEEQRAIGALLAKQDQAVEALRWIEQALAHFVGKGEADGIARARLTRAIALRKLGRNDEALADLVVARDHFQPLGNLRFLARIHEERALVHAARGEWRAAYEASVAQREAQQALERRAAEEQSARLRVQFGTDRKDEENRALQAENASRSEALASAERLRQLQVQVISLGAVLLAVVAALAWRQLLKARRMRVLALTDELTRLPNRRHILAFLDDQIQVARRLGQPLAVISFDIDHFKRVNDNHGHDAGDIVLQAVASSAKDALRRSDRVGRVGGEEFLAVLPASGRDVAVDIAERMRLMVEATALDHVTPGLRVTISLGVVEWGGGQDAAPSLIKRADAALYAAKHAGRNRVVPG